MSLHKWIYSLGMRLRNPEIPDRFSELEATQGWSRDQLRDLQTSRLRALLFHADEHSPFYHRRFRDAAFRPRDLQDTSDLSRLPPLEKSEVLAHVNEIQNAGEGKRLVYSETSGTTGEPLVFHRDLTWDAWHRASVFRGYSQHGIHPWDPHGYLWGFNFSLPARLKTRLLDSLQNRFRLFSYDEDSIRAFLRKLRQCTFLRGYSSMIYEVAKVANALRDSGQPPGPFRLRLVLATSETVLDAYRIAVQTAFNVPLVSEYGSAEAGIIGFDCPSGSMHVNMETVLVEDDDDGVLVTNLVSKSFPFIRYRLGDRVLLDEQRACPCGRSHTCIQQVVGRAGKTVFGKASKYPSLTLYYVFKNVAIATGQAVNYQAEQIERGKILVRVEGHITKRILSLIETEFGKYFGNDLDVSIVPVQSLKGVDRKKVDFISRV